MTTTTYRHIVLDESGTAWIEDANTKVSELVAAVRAHGWSPEELAYQFAHLTLGQVHSALAYYWDHREQVDQVIEASRATVAKIRSEVGDHPLVEKLEAQGRI